jgi:peptide/nickel transport system permease protein
MSNISISGALTSVEAEEYTAEHRSRSGLRDYTMLAIGMAPLLVLFIAALVAPLPFSPTHPNVGAISLPPNATHIFGTDASGFDIFSRTIAAARVDLPLAIGGTLIAMLIGVPIGLAASSETWGANAVMRFVDAMQSLPLLIVALAIVSLAGNHIQDVLIAIVIVSAPAFIRLTRSGALVVRNSRYVEAATACGCRTGRLLRVHVLPNVLSLVLAQAALGGAVAIVVIAGLNFLGVGVSPPTPTWGSMVATGAGVIDQGQWWVALFPGLAILLVIVCFNVIARAVEDLTGAR